MCYNSGRGPAERVVIGEVHGGSQACAGPKGARQKDPGTAGGQGPEERQGKVLPVTALSPRKEGRYGVGRLEALGADMAPRAGGMAPPSSTDSPCLTKLGRGL